MMVTLVFSRRGRQGRRRRRWSGGVEEDEAAGVPGTASGVEEEDGTTAIDGGTGGGASLLFGLKSNKTGKNCLLSLTPHIALLGVKSSRTIFV